MPEEIEKKFSDVLCALVSGVAHARSVADLEALRIAHHYRKNTLLQGLPIPRLRIKRISISLPLILKDLIVGVPAQASEAAAIARAGAKALQQALKTASNNISQALELKNPSEEEKKKLEYDADLLLALREDFFTDGRYERYLSEKIQDALQKLEMEEGGSPPSDAAIRDAVGTAADEVFTSRVNEVSFVFLKSRVESADRAFDAKRARNSRKRTRIFEEPYIEMLREAAHLAVETEAVLTPTTPSDFCVNVDTDSIKNAGGGPDVVTRLSMILHEEGLEWLNEAQEDGSQVSKLLPE